MAKNGQNDPNQSVAANNIPRIAFENKVLVKNKRKFKIIFKNIGVF